MCVSPPPTMEAVTEALAAALTKQLSDTGVLTKEQLTGLSKEDIERACSKLTEDEEFVSAVVSPKYRNALLLEMAAQGRPDLLHTLIRLGADVNHTPSGGVPHVGLTPLMRAARQGCRECVRLLVDAKADVAQGPGPQDGRRQAPVRQAKVQVG